MTVQRLIELRGIPTVVITVSREQTEQANPPRALCPTGFEPGHSLGLPDPGFQKRVILDALGLVADGAEPGKIVDRAYR